MKKLFLLIIPIMFLLTGCSSEIYQPITPESEGAWNQLLIWFSQAIIWLSLALNGSMALGIIAATVIIRVITAPLYHKQLISAREMKKHQPEIQAISKKYEGKSGSDIAMKKNQETQAVYKRYGINPFAGCLPSLIQLPILIAFYQVILRLTVGDGTTNGLEAFGVADQISTTTIFGGDVAAPSILFAFLAAFATYLSTRMSSTAYAGNEDIHEKTQLEKLMPVIFPIMIFIFGITVSMGVTLYWTVSYFITVLQALYVRRQEIRNSLYHADAKKKKKK